MEVEKLPADHYAVFKNVTKYSIWELEDLLSITGLNLKEFNKRKVALDKEDYRKYRKRIQKNMKDHQIPQGSSISAVLANIYMIEADKKINEYVVSLGGMYRRYSDDFIVVVPKIGQELSVFNRIIDIIHSVPNLQLEPSKTQIFEFSNNQIENVGKKLLENADTSKKVINFLGFTFDGGHVFCPFENNK